MKNGASVKKVVEEAVVHYLDMAEKQHGRKFEMPEIGYFHKGRKAGDANPWEWRVRFNTGLLEDNLQRYLVRTIPHEVAHLVVFAVHGVERKGGKNVWHGEKFKAQMRAFGCEETRCHTMDTSKVAMPKRKTKKHIYVCECGHTLNLSSVRHNKMVRGRANYHHKCHTSGKLTYTGKAFTS